jgi:hypothetical protein
LSESTSISLSGKKADIKMRFKKLTSLIGATAASATLLVSSQGTAQAAFDSCPAYGGYFCAWFYQNGDGWIYKSAGNGWWPDPVKNDDMSWYNRGYYCYGCDHVRIYDADNNKGLGSGLTLCVHRGQKGSWSDGASHARNRGDRHTWGGECRSWEPQMSSPVPG